MYFRKLRSILTGLNCASNAMHYSTTGSVHSILAKYFGYTESYVMKLNSKLNLKKLEYDELKELLRLFDELGFDRKEVFKYPQILSRTRRVVESHHIVLKEIGFSEVTVMHVINFRSCMHKTIKTLKTLQYIPEHLNVPETLISILHPKPVDFNVGEFTDDDIVSQIHCIILKQYLMWRLEASKDEIETFFRVYGTIKFKSFRHICENIDLALKLGFKPRTFLKFGYVLTTIPDYPKTVLETKPNLAGSNMKTAMIKFPKLITVAPLNFDKIYKLLRDAGIDDSTIRNSMNVFTLSPDTVRIRLNEIKNTPELSVLQNNPKVLQLIVHHNRARSRLSFLQQLQLKCASLMILGNNDRFFEANIRNGRDVNKITEVVNLLVHLLDTDKDVIEENLKKHPYHLQIPLVEIERSIKYLQKKYKRESIINVLPIVLYPSHKIEAALTKLKHSEHLKLAKLSDTKRLNLALYYIEKEHHFTGNGVW